MTASLWYNSTAGGPYYKHFTSGAINNYYDNSTVIKFFKIHISRQNIIERMRTRFQNLFQNIFGYHI